MTGLRPKSGPRRVAPVAVPPPSLTHPSHSMPPYSGSRRDMRRVAPPSPEEEDIVAPSRSPSPSEVSSPEHTPSPGINTEDGHEDLHDILVECANASRLVREAVLAEVELRLAHLALQTHEVICTQIINHEPRHEFDLYFLQDQNPTDRNRHRTSRPSSTRGNARQGSNRARHNQRSQPPESARFASRNTQVGQHPALDVPPMETSSVRTRNARRAHSPAAVPPPPPSVASSTAVASGSSVASDDNQSRNVRQIDQDDGSRDERRRWYVITKGRGKIGIFQRWLSAAPYCHKVPGAQYQSFSTRAEALCAFNAAERDGHTEFL